MTGLRYTFLMLMSILFLISKPVNSQEKKITPFANGSFQYAFIVNSHSLALFNGMSGRIGLRKPINERFDLSISGGISQYNNHRFYPITLGGHLDLNGKSSSFFSYHFGYSMAHFNARTDNGFQTLHGGLIHRLFWEKKLLSLKDLELTLELGLKYQHGVYQSNEFRTKFGLTSIQTGFLIKF